MPNLMDSVKDDVEETTDDIARISKEELKDVSNKLDEYNAYSSKVEEPKVEVTIKTEPEKTNVNVDPDKVKINNNTVISDDEFFDDFFGDD